MAWQVALVLDTEYTPQDIAILVHQMPVWAVETAARREAASVIRSGAGELWAPDPAFTLFTPASATDREEVCLSILGTLLEHHPYVTCLELIGSPASPALTKILEAEDFEPAAPQWHEGLPFRKPIERLSSVRELLLDARRWKTNDDLYESFFKAVGAPPWHGKNFDALKDSIVTGDINKIEVPYRLVIENFGSMANSVRPFAKQFVELIERFENFGCPVAIRIR